MPQKQVDEETARFLARALFDRMPAEVFAGDPIDFDARDAEIDAELDRKRAEPAPVKNPAAQKPVGKKRPDIFVRKLDPDCWPLSLTRRQCGLDFASRNADFEANYQRQQALKKRRRPVTACAGAPA